MAQWVIADRVDLSKDAQRQQVGAPEALMLPGDNEAHRWEITVLNNGEAADLAGASVAGYFLRSDGETVAVVGSVTDNVISVVLAQECYAFEGLMRAIVRVTLNGVITTVIQRLFRVQQDIGDQIIDPGEVIPDIDELLAQIAAMEAATAAANAAAVLALPVANAAAAAASSVASIDLNNVEWEAGALSTSNGYPTSNDRLIYTPEFYLVSKGAEIVFTGLQTNRVHQAFFYDVDKVFIAPRSSKIPYEIPDEAVYVRFVYGFTTDSGQTVTGYGGVDATAADWDIIWNSAIAAQIEATASNVLIENKNPLFSVGFAYNTSGTTAIYTEVANFSCVCLNVRQGQKYKIVSHGSNTCLPWSVGNENGVLVRKAAGVTADEIITISAEERILFVNGFTAEAPTVYLLNSDGTISEIVNEISELQEQVNPFIGDYSTAGIWESGQISPTTGNIGPSGPRIRTKSYVPDDVHRIYTTAQTVALLAYDKSNNYEFKGAWNGTIFDKTSTGITHTDIWMSNIRTAYPQYQYRLVWYGPSGTTADVSVDCKKIKIYNEQSWKALSSTLQKSTIVNMGDSIFGLFDPPTDISSFLANGTGATVYNCAVGGTCAVSREENCFDLPSLVTAIISGDFSAQDAAIEASSTPEIYRHIATLKTVDFNAVDVLTLSYGTNDYGVPSTSQIGTIGNGDVSTFIGALEDSIAKLQAAFPLLRIFMCTPIFRARDVDGIRVNADVLQNSAGLTLLDFVNGIKAVCTGDYIGLIDNHYIGINLTNWRTYLNDGTHPNETGRNRIARSMIKQIY